jgi:hypothetical protein
MAITSVTISQKNITDSINLLSVHNPLVFLVDVAYTSAVPEVLNVGIYDNTDTLLDTFACIPYLDTTGVRKFAFLADDILRGYMGSIDDFKSEEKVLEYVDGITKEFKLIFYDPDVSATDDEVSFVAMHAAGQYSDTPYLESIYINQDDTYYAAEGKPVYVYIYNDAEENIITVGSGEVTFLKLLDYDDVALLDFDDQYLLAL